MTYTETISYLFRQLPMYQREGKAAYKADLSNTLSICKLLNNPEDGFKSIHIAGTNGKGSTSHFIASILQEAGYNVGLYTSPHLLDFRERIKINGKMIPEQEVVDFVENNKEIFTEVNPSFFEWTVGLAFSYFANQNVDIAVIETGLGGRLDSTNVISPLVSVITNIGLDHTQFLGESLDLVAIEKGGIIKKDTPVVIGETQSEIAFVFENLANNLNAPLKYADKEPEAIALNGLVKYQMKNAQTAIVSVKELRAFGFEVSNNNVVRGIDFMSKNTGLRGRWEIVGNKPLIIVDTAHNKEGLSYTMSQLADIDYRQLRIVFGMVNDKSVEKVINLLPPGAKYYLCQPSIERALKVGELEDVFNENNFFSKKFENVEEAVTAAVADSQVDDVVYIGGSTFVVADALKLF